MSLELLQCIIKTETAPREYRVMQIPQNYIIEKAILPTVFSNQSKPSEGSVVLVARIDPYRAYIISVLRDPIEFINNDVSYYRGTTPSQPISPGEIHMESTGHQDSPGFGAQLYLGNNGCALIQSGMSSERLVIGGENTDDDLKVILQGTNGFFESHPNPVTKIQSTVNFDSLNTLRVANQLVPLPEDLSVLTKIPDAIPLSELKLDTLGNVTLRNAVLGTGLTLSALKLDLLGNVTLYNTVSGTIFPLGSLSMLVTGDVTLKSSLSGVSQAQLTLDTTGSISLFNQAATIDFVGPVITINDGTTLQGAARFNDLTLSNLTIDPVWWTFWQNLSTLISALPTTPLDGGATLKTGLAALFALVPTQIVGKINSSSATVRIGD